MWHITKKALKSVSNDSFYEKQSIPLQKKFPISLETEKRPIKNMFKNAYKKENFKKWPHWPYIHITPDDNFWRKELFFDVPI